jgi:hypothetical protein
MTTGDRMRGTALEEATPRPWMNANGIQVLIPPRQDEPPRADGGRAYEILNLVHREDAALIVAAVNDYERLLRIEQLARAAFDMSRPPMRGHEWYCVRPTDYEALRAALDGPEGREGV